MKMIRLLLLVCVLSACQTQTYLQDVEMRTSEVDQSQGSDPEIESYISPYRAQLEEEMNEVIGTAAISLNKAKPESTLGNWMCDAILSYARDSMGLEAALCFQNYGGLRISEIRKGDVTRSKIFELMPFDNTLHILHLDRAVAQMFFDRIAADGGWPASAGLSMRIVDGKAKDVRIYGEELESFDKVSVALPDYISNGGGDCDFLQEVDKDEYPVLIRDILLAQAMASGKRGEAITAKITNRIVEQ